MNILTDLNQNTFVELIPFKASFTDNEDSSRLYIDRVVDNITGATIYWQLKADSLVTYNGGQYSMTNEEYKNWGIDNNYLYEILIKNLPLQLL